MSASVVVESDPGHAPAMLEPEPPNERCGLAYVSDALADGSNFHVLAVVNDFIQESLAFVPGSSLSGKPLTSELDTIIKARGKPATVASNNGIQMTSMAVLACTQKLKFGYH